MFSGLMWTAHLLNTQRQTLRGQVGPALMLYQDSFDVTCFKMSKCWNLCVQFFSVSRVLREHFLVYTQT